MNSNKSVSSSLTIATLVAVSIGNFLVAFDASAINVASAQIINDLGGSHAELQWVLDGYTIPLCAFLFLSGTLGDRWGPYRVYKIATALFLISSIGCALASSLSWLIIWRVAQGASASFMLPMTLSIIADAEHNLDKRARAVGLWGVVGGCAIALGPLIGGYLSYTWSWRTVFWLNLPICAIALLGLLKSPYQSKKSENNIPWLTQVLFLSSLFGFAWLMISVAHNQITGFMLIISALGVGIIFLMLFIANKRSKNPLIPLELWQHSRFIKLVIAGAIYQFCSYGALLVFTLWAALSSEVNILEAGLLVMPCSIAWLAGNVSAWLSKSEWRNIVIRGGILSGIAGAICVVLSGSVPGLLMTLGMILAGYASGLLASSLSAQAMVFAPKGSSGSASGMFNTSRQLGMVIAIATIAGFSVHPTIVPQFSLVLVGYVSIFLLVRGHSVQHLHS